MAKRNCINAGSCPGYLEECDLQFPIEVRGGLEPGDKIFVCNVCMKVLFVSKKPRCSVCSMPLMNKAAHFQDGKQIFADGERIWPKHKFRPQDK